jgi:hypothetical protein
LTDAGNAALDFSQALFKMDISVRALQRNGMDTTLQSWTDEIKTLGDQFQVFSNIDIANALGQSALMGREFGLTQDQMVELTKTAMIFSEVTGRDLTGAIQAVTYFIDTGYTKSIRGLGVAISQSVLAQRALDMGFVQAYKDLEPVQQAQVRFAELTAQTNVLVKDSGLYLETWAGKMAKASTDAKNAMTDLGKTVEPAMVLLQQGWAWFVKVLANAATTLAKWWTLCAGVIGAGVAAVLFDFDVIKGALQGHLISWKDYLSGLEQAMTLGFQKTALAAGKIFGVFDEAATDALINQRAAEQQYATNLKQFDADVSQINSDYHDKEVTENTAFQSKMDDLNLKYTRDLSQINLDFDRREAAARTSAQNDQLSKEEAFQEKLLELREKYLYNLDDAVRARDARKVLDLNRQYNLELLQEQRQYAIEKKDAEENLKYQMALLEQEREQRLADRALQLAQDRADAKAAHEQKLADMKLEEQQKLQDLLTGFLAENHITEQGMQQIYDIIKKYVGPGGLVEGLYKYLRDYMAQAAANISINYAALSKVTATPIKGGGIAGYAEGGSVVATQPTAAIFGEAGPEMATFTPLNRPGADVNKVNGTLPKSGSGGKATISINLGAGLVGQIVDNAMGEVATVLLNAEG